MTEQVHKALNFIGEKIFDSGIVQKNIQEGFLEKITISISGNEDEWYLNIYIHLKNRESSEFLDDEEDDLFYAIRGEIEDKLEEDFEAIGFFGNEREDIIVNLSLSP